MPRRKFVLSDFVFGSGSRWGFYDRRRANRHHHSFNISSAAGAG